MEIYIANDRICITEILESDRHNCFAIAECTEDEKKIKRKLALKMAEIEGTSAEKMDERAEQLLADIDWQDIITETTFNGIIRLTKNNEFVGRVCLFCYTSALPELGIDILPKFQRQGYASEAIPMFLKFCKERFGVSRVNVRIRKDNLPSIRLFEKLGAMSHEDETFLSKQSLDYLHNQLQGIVSLGRLEEKTVRGYYLDVK